MADLWENQKVNLNKIKLEEEAPAVPCGLVAKSFFNDTFELWKTADSVSPSKNIMINSNNIAWTSDVTYKFDNIK